MAEETARARILREGFQRGLSGGQIASRLRDVGDDEGATVLEHLELDAQSRVRPAPPRNTKLVSSLAIRHAYMTGFEEATRGTPHNWCVLHDGRMKPYYDAGYRFGSLMRGEAKKLAEHYGRDYLPSVVKDAAAPTERPPASWAEPATGPLTPPCETPNCDSSSTRKLYGHYLCENCYRHHFNDS